MTLSEAALDVGAYLGGAIPFGVIVTRVFAGGDVRAVGSGNIGATNVVRAAGKLAGAITLLLDAAKGAIPAYLGARFFGLWAGATAGGLAFLGHVYSPYLRLRGGKGIATGFGIFVALSPWAALAGAVTYALVFAATRVSALGSLAGVAAVGAAAAVRGERPLLPLWGLTAAVTLWRHRSNLRELGDRLRAKAE